MENKELSKNKYGIEYTKVGDFYLPNIALPKSRRTGNIGKYGRLRLQYLEEYHKAECTVKRQPDTPVWAGQMGVEGPSTERRRSVYASTLSTGDGAAEQCDLHSELDCGPPAPDSSQFLRGFGARGAAVGELPLGGSLPGDGSRFGPACASLSLRRGLCHGWMY